MSTIDNTLVFTPALPRRPRALSSEDVATSRFPRATSTDDWYRQRDWLPDALIHIKELDLLPEGWDGTVAPPPSAGSRFWAASFVELVHANVRGIGAPLIVPTVNGGVSIEWHRPDAHIDFESEAGDITVFARTADGFEWEGELGEGTPAEVFSVLLNFCADD